MNSAELLADAFGRVRELVEHVVDGLSVVDLHLRLDDQANSIAWLIWHLTRVQDDHVADAAGTGHVWTDQGWSRRYDLSLPVESTGFGHDSADVAAVRVDSADILREYHDAVYQRTLEYLRGLSDSDLDRIVDESWSPPVTLGVRLVSVVGDTTQHAGQAAFIRGILERRGG